MALSSLVPTTAALLRFVRDYLRASDLAVAAAVLFACSAARSRLSTKPGAPVIWPVFGIIPSLFAHIDDIYSWGTAALSRAGGTFPYRGTWGGGSSGVVTSVPANVEHVLKTNFANYPKGPYYRERFVELLGDGIFNADGDAWRAQRRAATAEMHSARFLEFSAGTIGELVRGRLIPLLDGISTRGDAVDLQDVLLRFTFDNICAAAFGVDAGCLAEGLPDVPFARAFERATELSLARFVTPPFVWKAKRLLGVGTERALVEAAAAVRAFAERTVAERRAELRKTGTLAGRCDLLSRLMASPPPADLPEGYSDAFLRDFCISFILAGRDTSSVALTWFFWLLASHPHVESRVLADIAGAEAKSSSTTTMDYLHAALTESMRLYPPVPADFKEALEDDVLPDGTVVRARQRVIYYTYAMGRDKASWGPDCLEFRPERWLNPRTGAFAGGAESPYKYVVFNAGPRLCVGKRFAYAQMKAVAAAVLGRFRVEVLPGQEEVKPKLNTTLYMKHGLMVRFAAREQRHEPRHAVPAAEPRPRVPYPQPLPPPLSRIARSRAPPPCPFGPPSRGLLPPNPAPWVNAGASRRTHEHPIFNTNRFLYSSSPIAAGAPRPCEDRAAGHCLCRGQTSGRLHVSPPLKERCSKAGRLRVGARVEDDYLSGCTLDEERKGVVKNHEDGAEV